MTDEERLEYWRERLSGYVRAKVHVVDWCRANGVAVKSFYLWRQRLQEAGRASCSVDDNIPSPSLSGASGKSGTDSRHPVSGSLNPAARGLAARPLPAQAENRSEEDAANLVDAPISQITASWTQES